MKLDIPCLDVLEEYLRDGYTIEFKDDVCYLMTKKGHSFVSGETLRNMIVNLVMADNA